jgi:hypothetical protein
MFGTAHPAQLLLIPLVAATLLIPDTAAHAEGRAEAFRATFTGAGQLTVCGENTYCISDQGTGSANGLGAATLTADETESLVDPSSPCAFLVQGTATITGAGGDTLSLRFELHTCGFGTDDGATLVKPGAFVVTGGTGRFAHATGAGTMYKIGVLSSPSAVFQFAGAVSGSSPAGGQGPTPSLGGARCDIGADGTRCLVLTTNTVAPYTAAQCASAAISGRYVLTDRYDLSFDPTGLAMGWRDAQAASGSLSGAPSGQMLPFLLAEELTLHFAAPGDFGSSSTRFDGPGLVFLRGGVQAIRPGQIAYDANGRIVVTDSTTLSQVCAALS